MKRSNGKKKSLTDQAEAAFEQASRKVIQRARQTGTPVVVWKDGHVEKIPGEQVELTAVQPESKNGNP